MIYFTPLQKQIYQPKKKQKTTTSEGAVSQNTHAPDEATGGEVLLSTCQKHDMLLIRLIPTKDVHQCTTE